ncbi:MAG: winged helix-turn-helix domain-containing protein [Planctomycetia bacterium]|nr:winged helix-turn-helix domain-containing protein [Planctomycetia bacterium]
MTKIKIGKCYSATLSKGEAPIRIESVHEDGGWVARTLLTSRMTRIKTPEQIVRECEPSELEEYTNRSNERPARVTEATTVVESTAEIEPTETVPTVDIMPEGETDDIYEMLRRKPKSKMSLLDAAHRVLTEFGGELSASDIVKAVVQKGYWQTQGKTPGNTLNAAITREIKAKGENSRFAKSTRGCFVARTE